MKKKITNEITILKKKLSNVVIKKYLLKKKLSNVVIKNSQKNKNIIKSRKFLKHRLQTDGAKKWYSIVKKRYFGYRGWLFRRFIKRPLKRKKIKRLKKLNLINKNSIKPIFYRIYKPSFTKIIKLRNNLKIIVNNRHKNLDIKINKNFILTNNI